MGSSSTMHLLVEKKNYQVSVSTKKNTNKKNKEQISIVSSQDNTLF